MTGPHIKLCFSSSAQLPFCEIAPFSFFHMCHFYLKLPPLSHSSVLKKLQFFSLMSSRRCIIDRIFFACQFCSFVPLIKIFILVSCLESPCLVSLLQAAIWMSHSIQAVFKIFTFHFWLYKFQLLSYWEGNTGTFCGL